MGHDRVVMLLDPFMGFALPVMTLRLLTVVLDHRLLKLGTGAFALICGHPFFVVVQTVLVTLNRFGVGVESLAVLANDFLQFCQLGQSRFMLRAPAINIVAPDGVFALPIPVVGMHAGESKDLLFHRYSRLNVVLC